MNEYKNYLNSDEVAKEKISQLLGLYIQDRTINLRLAERRLTGLIDLSFEKLGNIRSPGTLKHPNTLKSGSFLLHNKAVSKTCSMLTSKILENYPRLNLNANRSGYLGLVEDVARCIVSDPGQEIHEIIGFGYFSDLGYEEIVYKTQLHFVGPEMLDIFHNRGKFSMIKKPELETNIDLKITTVADALCTDRYLGEKSIPNGFEKRLVDFKNRYFGHPSSILKGEEHLLAQSLKQCGKKRLRRWVTEIDNLYKGKIDENKVYEMFI